MTNLYRVLRITTEADEESIRLAYKQRSRETHPDAGGTPEDFQEVTEAYRTLSDPDKKKAYLREYFGSAAKLGHVVCAKCLAVNRVRAIRSGESVRCAQCKVRLPITAKERDERYGEAFREAFGDLLTAIGAESSAFAKDLVIKGFSTLRRKLNLRSE